MTAIWHYAVWKGTSPFMEPACAIARWALPLRMINHGLTIDRGEVNCERCMRAMGMEVTNDGGTEASPAGGS